MSSGRFALTAVSAVLLAAGSASLHAQSSKGSITGSAKDSTGAVIPNAQIKIRGEQTGETRTLTTGPDGGFRIDALSPEQYTITASHAGFSEFRAQHIVVNPSVVTSFDVAFSVGQQTDVVNVEADALTINADNGQLAGTVSSKEITDLPVFSLNPIELASTIPGVQTVTGTNQFSNGQNFQVNGARPRSNNFLLDSQEINDIGIGGQAFQPNIPDLYQDLTVITSVASAEFGRAGGGIFNLVTKSGSNQYHGTVYDRYTDQGIDSTPHSLRGTGTPNPRQSSHTLGFTLGGFIIKDKLFGEGASQFSRVYGNEILSPVLLPDAAGVATLNSITDPTAKAQVALLNQYTTNNFYLQQYQAVNNTQATQIKVGGIPTGCASPPCSYSVEENYFQRPASAEKSPDTQWSYRVDFKPHEKDTFYVRYLHDRSSLSPDFFANAAGGALGLDTSQGGPSELGAGSWTHVFSPTLLNELRASETRISFVFAPLASTLANPAYALPTVGISGFPTLGPIQNFPQGRAEDLYQVQDTLSVTRGRQSIRAGFDIGHQIEKDIIPQTTKGSIAFVAGGQGVTALGNFLLNQTGPSGSISKTVGPTRTDPHVWRSGFFAQDDIKFSPALTINLGVRYDYTGNPENSLQYPGIDVNNPFAPITTVTRVTNDKNNISPRIGFAYSPQNGGVFGGGKTVVRGGFGIFYDNYFSNFVTNAAQSAPNTIASTTVVTTGGGVLNPFNTVTALTPVLSGLSSDESVDSHMVNPLTYQYNLGLEQDVHGTILAVRYVGNHGEKLFANQQFNYFDGTTGQRLNPNRGPIVTRGNYASSNYNGLEADASKNFRNQVSIRASYVFSKDLDNGSEIFATGDSGSNTSYPNDLAPNARYLNYGPSAFDHRHYASISYVWTPKGLHASNPLLDTAYNVLTRNWTISGIEQFQSGPWSSWQIAGIDINGDGNAYNDRPILGNVGAPLNTTGIDGTYLGGTPGVYYDMAAFNLTNALNPVTAAQVHFLVPYGPANQYVTREIGRNSFSNPGSTRNDASIEKGFSVPRFERGHLLLRVDVQNLANHNDRGDYLDTNVLDNGLPTSFNQQNLARQNSQRSLVLWGKFEF